MEMSVGFADKDKGVDYYIERGYRVEESELGKVYYLKRNAIKVGKIGITAEACSSYYNMRGRLTG